MELKRFIMERLVDYITESYSIKNEDVKKIIKPILDDLTDEKIGETHEMMYSITFDDGAHVRFSIKEKRPNVASIYSINAGTAEGDRTMIFRGSRVYERTLEYISNLGIKTISIGLQSSDTRFVLDRLVKLGILVNPRGIIGGSMDEHHSIFDIDVTKLKERQENAKIEPRLVSKY